MYRLTRNKKVRCELFNVDTDEQARHIWSQLTPEVQRQVSHYNNIANQRDRQKYLHGDGATLRDALSKTTRKFADMSDPVSEQITNLHKAAAVSQVNQLQTTLNEDDINIPTVGKDPDAQLQPATDAAVGGGEIAGGAALFGGGIAGARALGPYDPNGNYDPLEVGMEDVEADGPIVVNLRVVDGMPVVVNEDIEAAAAETVDAAEAVAASETVALGGSMGGTGLVAAGVSMLEAAGTEAAHKALNPDEAELIDTKKALTGGGIGGAITGAIVGFLEGGPVGAVIGAGIGGAAGSMATETAADVVDITYDGVEHVKNGTKEDPYHQPDKPNEDKAASAKEEESTGNMPTPDKPLDVKYNDEDKDDPDDEKHNEHTTLRQTFEMATPQQVVAATKAQMRSDIEFDMFSHVRPGYGNGERNKLFLLEQARDAVILGQRPMFSPGEWIGPTNGIEPGPWQFQRIIPEDIYGPALDNKSRRMILAKNTAACLGDDSCSLGVLGDDYGYQSAVSAKGLKRKARSPLEPQIRTDMQWMNMETPTGFQLNKKRFRINTDNMREPSRLIPPHRYMGGPTMKRRRAYEQVLY
jgi:hypothetical protein